MVEFYENYEMDKFDNFDDFCSFDTKNEKVSNVSNVSTQKMCEIHQMCQILMNKLKSVVALPARARVQSLNSFRD